MALISFKLVFCLMSRNYICSFLTPVLLTPMNEYQRDFSKQTKLRKFHGQCKRGGQNDDFRPLTYTLGGGAWGAGTNM
jgi:hypothetical protein